MNTLEIINVNKFNSDWDPTVLFKGFKIRAVLKHQEDLITKINAKTQLQRRLRREIGEEDVDWILQTNDRTNEDELYLFNSGKLVMWKLQDNTKFSELFDRVEQHRDDVDGIQES